MDSPRRPLSDQVKILNKKILHNSVTLSTTAFTDNHLAIHRLTETDNQDLVSHVISKLQESRLLRKRRWAKIRVDAMTEDARFAHLQSIADKIHEICLSWDAGKDKLGGATARMISNPGRTMNSALLEKPVETNAQFVLVSSLTGEGGRRDDAPLEDISSVARFRKSYDYHPDTQIDIVAAASHILYSDPARRSMTAFTIVGKTMTFFHFSRSHIAVSSPFDYHTEPEHLIRFLIFMMFASREELGYDPTITRVRVDAYGYTQYRFHIGAKIYQTLGRPLAQLKNLDVVTHAPRVWTVTELEPETMARRGKRMVLKDFWPLSIVKGELEIQTAIFDALRDLDKVGVPADECPLGTTGLLAEDAKKFFLTIALDAAVEFNGAVDMALVPESDFSMMTYSASYDCKDIEAPKDLPKLQAKTHRRVVFEEECCCISRLSGYATFALGMAQLIQGLYYMRLARFTHHDVSSGNCLMYPSANGWQLKISDLEYARPYDARFTEKSIIGTPGYMAVEYASRSHYFIPNEKAIRKPFFRHNFAHDLEAALWIYVRFLFDNVPDCVNAAETAQIRRDVQYYRDQLKKDGSPERRGFLLDYNNARPAVDALTALYGRVPGGSVLVEGLRCFDVLIGLYRDVEATEPLDPDFRSLTRWDSKFFQRGYYQCLHNGFLAIHQRLSESRVGYKAVRDVIFEFDAAQAAAQHPPKRAFQDGEEPEEEEGVRKKQCAHVEAE
ncbi:hypothetical protein BDZ89DRAFT_1148130 [Hymenopellis radicata]|nr:hypothetical protein BDZ89DRAFT_1148130 [Hymenopellis radicata]